MKPTHTYTLPAVYSSAEWSTVVRLLSEGVPVLSIENIGGSHCPLTHFDDSNSRASSIAEAFKSASAVPVLQKLAKQAEKR
jgi:hypothetical protein